MRDYQKTLTARNNSMRRLKEEGKTLEQIAQKYGITRARVHQILQKSKVLDKS